MRALKIAAKITQRDNDSFDKYLKEIAKIDLLTPKQEVELSKRIAENPDDQQAIEKLVNANLRFVVSVAKQYQNYGVSLSDLISAGNIGLIKAAKRFDHTRGFKFISYAVWWIRQSINTAVSEHNRMVRLPANCEDAVNEYNRIRDTLQQKLNREPTFEEILDQMSKNNEKNRLILYNGFNKPSSLDAPLSTDEGDTTTLGQTMPDDETFVDSDTKVDRDYQRQQLLDTINKLPELEKKVICARFGLDGNEPCSYEEIGYALDLTGERIRQITKKALMRLKSPRFRKIFNEIAQNLE